MKKGILAAVVVFILAGAGAWLALSGGTGPRYSGPPPNLLLLSVDALRADRLGAYGCADCETPAIDALAAGGVMFEQAVAAATWTQPSVAAMHTGRWPAAMSASQTGETTQSLHADETTLAEVLKAAGYATASFVDNGTLAPHFGYGQGFDFTMNDAFDDGEKITRPAIEWLRENKDRQFFLWVHWLDPHMPYRLRGYPPYSTDAAARAKEPQPVEEPYIYTPSVGRELRRHYDSEVTFTDRCAAMVLAELKRLGLENETLIVFTADHGESLGERHEGKRRYGHGDAPYEEQALIPLVLRWPGVVPEGVRVKEQVSNVDILPTVLDLLRLPAPENVAGVPLTGALDTGVAPAGRLAYSQSFRTEHGDPLSLRFGVRTNGYKLFARADGFVMEQYAREGDTGKMQYVRRSSIPDEQYALMEKALKDYVILWASGPTNPSDEIRKRLEALGYM